MFSLLNNEHVSFAFCEMEELKTANVITCYRNNGGFKKVALISYRKNKFYR
jgi:hypothetical protein